MSNIPESWKDYSFGDIVKFSGGAQPPRSTFKFEPHEGYIRLIQTRDYKTDKYITYIPEDLARKKCLKDDIMIGRYGPPIFQILRGLEGAYNVALLKAIPDESQLCKEYLYYFISQYKVWAFVENLSQRSGGQTGVDLDQLRKYPFPLPPLPEQQKIAEILSTVDEKIELIDRQIAETTALKKGMMQRLLTKGIGHTQFKESVLGEIPVGWEVVKFESLLKERKDSLGYGILQPGTGVENGVNMVRTVDLTEVGRAKTQILKVPENISQTSPTTILKGGEVLLSVMGTLGRTYVVPHSWAGWNVNRALAVIRTKDIIDNHFLCHFFRSPYFKRVIEKQSLGSAQMRINLNDLRKYNIPLPPLNEQLEISKRLNLIDGKLSVIKDKKSTFYDLKKGLMQQLLTGKIRVNPHHLS